jgi:histidyl-tRNA synthetase
MPGRSIVYHCGSAGLKNQLKRADRSGARLAVIIGEDELAAGEVTFKPLRDGLEQRRIVRAELSKTVKSYFE